MSSPSSETAPKPRRSRGQLTLRDVEAITHLLEHGRWPDPDTAEWVEARASRVAIDFLMAARLRPR